MRRAAAAFAVVASAVLACGGGQTSGDGDTEPDGATCPSPTATPAKGYPAAHAPFPQVTYQSGGLVLAPEVVTVTFPGDELASALQDFDDTVLQSCWWDAVSSGYCESGGSSCIGKGVVPGRPHVELSTAPAASYTDSVVGAGATLQTFVQDEVASGALPAPGANTVYAFYFPATTSIVLDGAQSCDAFGGYHNTTRVTPPGGAETAVPYAVVPRCETQSFLSLFKSQLDELTFAASHEITESVTDPNAGLDELGFYLPQVLDSVPWNEIGGGEIGDLCVDYIGEAEGTPDDQRTAITSSGSYVVQRIWSNAAAAAGGDPCVPVAPGETYFNVAIAEGAGTLQLAVGQSATIDLTAFSTGPLSWKVVGQDLASLQGQSPVVSVTLSQATVENGDTLTATVTLLSKPPPLKGTSVSGEPYLLVSQSGTEYHLWPGVILGAE